MGAFGGLLARVNQFPMLIAPHRTPFGRRGTLGFENHNQPSSLQKVIVLIALFG
jgi:hypothetical protein